MEIITDEYGNEMIKICQNPNLYLFIGTKEKR